MANEAGSGCLTLTNIDNYSFIDGNNPAEAGNVTALRTQKQASVGAGEASFDFGDVNATPQWTSAGENPGGDQPFAIDTDADCYVFTAGVDFTQFSVSASKKLGVWQTENVQYSTSGGTEVWYNNGNSLVGQSGFGVTRLASGRVGIGADISGGGAGLSLPIARRRDR